MWPQTGGSGAITWLKVGFPRGGRAAEARRSDRGLAEVFKGVGNQAPEASVVEGGGDLGVTGGVGRLAEIGDGHAGGKGTGKLDVDRCLAGLDDVRIDEISDGARVVDRWVIKALIGLVCLAEETEEAHDELRDRSI